jgi:N-acetylmuramoyl-L-alanine amidase
MRLARFLHRSPAFNGVQHNRGEQRMYVCIDAGHGGADTGVIGFGATEKWITGEAAVRTGETLYTAGCMVFFTRMGDRKVSLPERLRSVRDSQADLFLSLHCAHSPWAAHRGLELFYPRGDPRSQAWADALLRAVETRLNGRTIARGARPISWRYRCAGSGLLNAVGARMPACLIQLGFLSNPLDAWLLQERFFLDDLARGIAAATLAWQRRLDTAHARPEGVKG